MAKLSCSSLKELVLMNTEKLKTKGKPVPANKRVWDSNTDLTQNEI